MLKVFTKQVPIRNTWYFRFMKRILCFVLFLFLFLLLFLLLLLLLFLLPMLIFLVFGFLIPIPVPGFLLAFAIIVTALAIRMRTIVSSTSCPAHLHHTLGSLYKPALLICICHYWRE